MFLTIVDRVMTLITQNYKVHTYGHLCADGRSMATYSGVIKMATHSEIARGRMPHAPAAAATDRACSLIVCNAWHTYIPAVHGRWRCTTHVLLASLCSSSHSQPACRSMCRCMHPAYSSPTCDALRAGYCPSSRFVPPILRRCSWLRSRFACSSLFPTTPPPPPAACDDL